MKNFYFVCILFLFSFSSSFAQSLKTEYTLGKERDFNVVEGYFFDNGGKDAPLLNEYFITTLHSTTDVDVFFEELNIPNGARLNFYLGKNTKGQLVGSISHFDKISNITGKEITIEYIPTNAIDKNIGNFKGVIKRTSNGSNQRGSSRSQPESDCPYAIPLCQNLTAVALAGQYTDLGAVSDDAGGCYGGTGSGGSVWYSFQPQTDGPLDFTITPTGSTDYDFVLWDITAGCASNQRQEISCNYSLITGATGLSSTLCSQAGGSCSPNDCTTDSKGSDCNKFNRRPNVLASHKYAVCINFYSGSNDGFNIQFKNEASSVTITDITPPTILNATANSCPSATQFKLRFSEYIDCSTLQAADLTLPGHTVTITNTNCANGVSNTVDVTISPALTSGTYSLHGQDILDLCGNNMNSNFSIVIGANPTPTISPNKTTCKSPGFLGIGYTYSPATQSLTAGGGTFYQWSDGQIGATVSVAPTATTVYTVTVTQGACPATASVTVTVEAAPVVSIPDQNFCAGQSRTLTATGGGTYQWYTGPSLFGNGTAIAAPAGTAAVLNATPSATTTYRVIVTSPGGCKGQDDVTLTLVTTNCCNASITPVSLCANDAPVTLVVGTAGGTFSGPGITNTTTGVFDPTVAGVGSHKIYYQLSCGTDSAIITVTGCSAVNVCRETNGNLTVSGGTPAFTWSYWKAASSTPITNSATCTACGGSWTPFVNICTSGITTITSCPVPAGWVQFATGTTVTPPVGKDTIKVVDGAGTTVTIYSIASVALCSSCPTITVTTTTTNTTCGLANGSASTTVSGGVSPYTYTWSNSGGSGSGLSNMNAGTYTVTVKDANLCSAIASVTIGSSANPTATSTKTDVTCNGANNGTLTVNASGGTGTLTYTWSPNVSTASSASSLAPNTYSVTVKDANNCTIVTSQTITQPTAISINTSSTAATCNSNNGSATATPSGGTGAYTYTWTGGATASTAPNLASGTYSVTVKDASLCSATASVTVSGGSGPIATSSKTDVTCNAANNGTMTVNASGGTGTLNYTWSPNVSTTSSASSLAPNTYSVTVKDANNCTVVTSQTISQPSAITISTSTTTATCGASNGSATATPSGGTGAYTYSWTGGATTATATSLAAGTYSVTVNDVSLCSAVASATVSSTASINTSMTATPSGCGTPSGKAKVTVTAGAGPFTYLWSNGQTADSATALSTGYVKVTVTGAGGCTKVDSILVPSSATLPNINAGVDTSLNCIRTSVILQATSSTAGVTFAWSNGINTANNTVNSANTYTVTATDPNNGCTASDAVVVSMNNVIPNANAVVVQPSCSNPNGSITVNPSLGTPPFNYSWSANAAVGNVNAATGLGAGTYTVSITSADGCEKDTTITIVAPPAAISIQGVVVNTLACHETTGTIGNVVVSGGTAPYNYVYAPQSNLSATTTIPALPFAGVAIGDYVLTVSDNFGCSDTFWFSVTRQDLFLNPVQASPESCIGALNGVINNAVPFYGTAPYQLGFAPTANPSAITPVTGFPVNGMTPGTYIMYATDSKGCTDSAWFSIGASITPCCTHSLVATVSQPTCANNDGAIDMTVSGALGMLTYAWGNGETTEDLSNLASGTYYVTVTDDITNCSKDTSFVLFPPSPPIVDAGLDVTLTCVLLNTNLTATSTTVGTTFTWSNGTNAASTLVSTANTYTVTATDPSNGCTASDAVVVTLDNATPNVNAGTDVQLTCIVTNTSLQATSTTAGVTYAWSNGVNTAGNLVSTPNTYTVTATNSSNGCTVSDAVDVTQNITTPNVDAGLDQTLSCTTSSATLSGTSTSAGVSYTWSGPGTIANGNTATATVTVSGNYTLLVTDPSNGCTASDIVVVTPNVNAPNINAGLDQVLTCVNTSVSLTATSSTVGVTFLWSDGTANASTTVNAPTTYSVTATDPNNGCQAVDQVVVSQNIAAPDVNAGADATLTCLITSIPLNATSTISGATFVWSNGTANATTTVNAPNIYTVTATDPSNGCTASDDVFINANGVPVLSIVSGDNPCPDVAKGYINTNVSGGVEPYTYLWSNGATTTSLNGLHGGTYNVTVTDANGCSLSQTIQIIEGDSLSITNLTSVQIPLGETIQLNPIVNGASAPLSYSWNPAVYLSCSNCSNPIVNTVNSISYGLLVVDTNGCVAESQVSIIIVPDYQIYVPSAFTPNNDGTNDVFEIFGNKKLWKELSMTIFNRWGEKVFESSDSKFAWDGTFHGVLQNPQIYVYQLRITFIDGYAMPLQKGSISLIR